MGIISKARQFLSNLNITPSDLVKPNPIQSFAVKKFNEMAGRAIPQVREYYQTNAPRVTKTIQTSLGNLPKSYLWKTAVNPITSTYNAVNTANKWLELDKPVINKTGNPYKDTGISLLDPPLRNIRGAFNLFNVPSYIAGGTLKEYNAQRKGEIPTTAIHPLITGGYKGLINKTPVFDEAPSALGVDPNSLGGMAIGLTGELLTPDPTDLRLLGKGKKILNAVDDLPWMKGEMKLEDMAQRSDLLSKMKNIADKSNTVSAFKKNLGMSQEALDAMKVSGFPDAETFWKYTHSGFNKVNNLLSESLAQTKYRLSQQSGNKSVDYLNEVKKEFKSSDGAFRKLPTGQQVQIWDYLRTPDRVLEKIGMGNEAKLLRQSWDNYLVELPKEVNKITEWSKQVTRPESNQLIFKYLDGQIAPNVLEPTELKVAGEIKTYLKSWADRLKLPQEGRITNYITHIFDGEDIAGGFPDDIAMLIKDKVAGSVYDPFLQKRLGSKGYIEDTWRVLDAYVKRATRKVNMDDTLTLVKDRSKSLDSDSFDYIKSYIDRINLRPTKADTLIDKAVKYFVGNKYGERPLTQTLKNTRQMVYRGLLGLNPASALKNLSQASNTYAELGEKYTITGYRKVLTELPAYLRGADTELERVGVLRDNFIQDRTLNATKKTWEKLDKGLFYMFEQAEKINRGGAYYGAKSKALDLGMDETKAIEYAKDIVRKTQFTFGAVDTPAILQSDIAKTLGQFMSYTIKQGEFLAEKVNKKEWAGLVRYVGASLLFINTIGEALGMDWKDMIPTIRLGVPPTLQAPYGALQVAVGAKNEYGQDPDSNIFLRAMKNKNLVKGVTSYIPAGGQIFKSAEGIKTYLEGKSKTPTGRTRFEVKQDVPNLIKSALLGKYSTPEGREYVNNLGKSKAEVTLEKYEKLLKKDPEKAKAIMLKIKQADSSFYKDIVQAKTDSKLKVSSSEKSIRNLPMKDYKRAVAIVKILKKYPAGNRRGKILARYKELGIINIEVVNQLQQLKQGGAF